MAELTKAHGFAASGEFVGRDLFFKGFTKDGTATISQVELDALVQAVQTVATVEVVGDFTAGTSTEVNMIISGADIADVADNSYAGAFNVSTVSF
jgi:hypothetical protein